MTWRNWIAQVFNRARPDAPSGNALYRLPIPQIPGIIVTPDTAMELSVVWACVDAISRAIASAPWNVYEVSAGLRTEKPDDPVRWLLNTRPNPDTTAIAFRQALMVSALTWGNGYAEIVRSPGPTGRVTALYPLNPARIEVRRETEAPWAVYYLFHQPTGGVARMEPSQVFHLRGLSIDGLMGDNRITRMSRAIAVALSAETFAAAYFANGGSVGPVLKLPAGQKLEPATIDRLRAEWVELRGGPAKNHKPLFLENGMEADTLSDDPGKAQLVETRKFSVEEICRFFNVPPHKVQHLERMTFNNVEWIGIDWVRDGLTPWTCALEQEADYKLFSQRAPWRSTTLDLSKQSQGDFKSRMEGYSTAVQNGIASRNECRAREGWNSHGPEADVLTVQSNMTTLQLAIEGRTLASAPGADRSREGLDPAAATDPAGDDAEADAGGEGEEPEPKPIPAPGRQIVREAAAMLVASVGERYVKRMTNREADLRRHGISEQKVAANLADERIRLRPSFLDECRGGATVIARAGGRQATDGDILLLADELDRGANPAELADRFVESLLPASATVA